MTKVKQKVSGLSDFPSKKAQNLLSDTKLYEYDEQTKQSVLQAIGQVIETERFLESHNFIRGFLY